MLSEKERAKLNSALSPTRFTARIKFKKTGNLQYISLLDLQRTFNRIFKRAELPMWYTKGFNPHMKLVFATPLSIGSESVCEYLDVQVDGVITCKEIKDRLNREVTDELAILDVYLPETKFSDIAWSDYACEFHIDGASAELAGKIDELLSTAPLTMIKTGKAGDREIDIIPLIKKKFVSYDAKKDVITMRVRLAATPEQFLNPEMLVSAMKQHLGILQGDPTKEYYTILRVALLDKDERDFR